MYRTIISKIAKTLTTQFSMSISSKDEYHVTDYYEPSEYSISDDVSQEDEFVYDDLEMTNRKNKQKKVVLKPVDDINFICHQVDGKSRKTYFYTTTYLPGAVIRNAYNGMYQSGFIVGKSDEDNFFKMAMTVGLGKNINGRNHLYYDNPQQYEIHFNTTLNDEVKKK